MFWGTGLNFFVASGGNPVVSMSTLTFRLGSEDRALLERLRGGVRLTRYVRRLVVDAARAELARREAEEELLRLRAERGVAAPVSSLPLSADDARARAEARAERERQGMLMRGAGIDRASLED